MRANYLLALPILLLGLQSCNENNGNTNADETVLPKIELIKPAQGDTVLRGDSLLFSAKLSDNANLKLYKLDVHHNFDGHNHGRISKEPINPFTYNQIFEVSGNTINIDKKVVKIPTTIDEGPYHFMVFLMDGSGNTSQEHIEFYIK